MRKDDNTIDEEDAMEDDNLLKSLEKRLKVYE